MAIKNRDTLKQQFDDFIDRVAPFDGNALIQKTEDKQVTNDELDSNLMKKDTESAINSPNSAIALDFVSVDLYTINSSGSIDTAFVFTISNLGTGQIARIAITKKSGDTYSFASGTFNQIDNLDQTGTSLNFYVHNVDGTLIVESDLSISKSDAINENNSNQLATSKAAFDLSAVDAGLEASKLDITRFNIEAGTPALITKVIEIGDWNMTSTQFVDVLHGIDGTKTRGITVIIRNDNSTNFYPFGQVFSLSAGDDASGIEFVSTTTVRLRRQNSGTIFSGANFDDTPFNRGWITITYEQ